MLRPGCGFHQSHHLRFEVDHIVALSEDGGHYVRKKFEMFKRVCDKSALSRRCARIPASSVPSP